MTGFAQKKVEFSFSLNWLLLIFLLAVLLISLFIFGKPEWRQGLVFSAAVLAAAATTANAANAMDARTTRSKQGRVTAAMDFIDRWNNPANFHCKRNSRAVLEEFKTTTSTEAQVRWLNEHPEHHSNLIDVLNLFEALSIGVQQNVVDDATARRFFRSLVVRYFQASEKVIKHKRAERSNTRLLCEFEALYNRWKD